MQNNAAAILRENHTRWSIPVAWIFPIEDRTLSPRVIKSLREFIKKTFLNLCEQPRRNNGGT